MRARAVIALLIGLPLIILIGMVVTGISPGLLLTVIVGIGATLTALLTVRGQWRKALLEAGMGGTQPSWVPPYREAQSILKENKSAGDERHPDAQTADADTESPPKC